MLITNFAFSHLIIVLQSGVDSIYISLSGSFLVISINILASIAIFPISITVPSNTVSIPNSKSLAVNLILSEYTSIRTHSSIGIVVFVDTAFDTILSADKRFCFEHFIFMC